VPPGRPVMKAASEDEKPDCVRAHAIPPSEPAPRYSGSGLKQHGSPDAGMSRGPI
jgi:hypothetical protein